LTLQKPKEKQHLSTYRRSVLSLAALAYAIMIFGLGKTEENRSLTHRYHFYAQV